MSYILQGFKNYLDFSGRARRSEYWYFTTLHNVLLLIIYLAYKLQLASTPITVISAIAIELIFFVPSYSVSVRRLHDVNKTGWYVFIPILLLIYSFFDSDINENKYGYNPKLEIDEELEEETEEEIMIKKEKSKKKMETIFIFMIFHFVVSTVLALYSKFDLYSTPDGINVIIEYILNFISVIIFLLSFLYPMISFIITLVALITSVVYFVKRKYILQSIFILISSVASQFLLLYVIDKSSSIISGM